MYCTDGGVEWVPALQLVSLFFSRGCLWGSVGEREGGKVSFKELHPLRDAPVATGGLDNGRGLCVLSGGDEWIDEWIDTGVAE